MLLSFVYLVFVSLLRLLVGGGRAAQVEDTDLILMRPATTFGQQPAAAA
jgi:hypothetical protein